MAGCCPNCGVAALEHDETTGEEICTYCRDTRAAAAAADDDATTQNDDTGEASEADVSSDTAAAAAATTKPKGKSRAKNKGQAKA